MKKLDFSGLPCPQPVLKCRDFLEQEQPNAFVVFVDNEAASINVQRFLTQHTFSTQIEKEGNLWNISAQKNVIQEQRNSVGNVETQERTDKKIIVFITTETMGSGDVELGTKLMGTFLATLPEMGSALWRVILLNGGVKLAATQGGALESLQKLSQYNVPILVCGTCLAHYGLSEQKAVGETSNMLDIVTSLALADMVIRP